MKKYRIELSEQQMRLIADCLEDVSRFASGQWEMLKFVKSKKIVYFLFGSL